MIYTKFARVANDVDNFPTGSWVRFYSDEMHRLVIGLVEYRRKGMVITDCGEVHPLSVLEVRYPPPTSNVSTSSVQVTKDDYRKFVAEHINKVFGVRR